ncbi:MAG: hypothetical protein Q9211_000832 [Gyalolechia sp. 1 TL-2023]
MDRPAKRRRLLQPDTRSPNEAGRMDDDTQTLGAVVGNQDAVVRQFLPSAIVKVPTVSLPGTHTASSLCFDQGKPYAPRLHPRDIVASQATPGAVKPIVDPVLIAVSSIIEVVLESGGTSVGNVFVPAESTVFNLDGYGPITIDRKPPPNATPSPEQQNLPPAPPALATHTHRHSHSSQPTPQPAPMPDPQPSPSAAASQGSPPDQSPMYQLSNCPVVSSHSVTAESIQLNVSCDRRRVIL